MTLTVTQHTPQFATAGQIDTTDVAAIAAAGFRSIVCNRPDGEAGPSQPASDAVAEAARAQGLQFAYLPVVPGMITAEDGAAFAALLKELPGPVLAYCRSGARSTSLYQIAGMQS